MKESKSPFQRVVAWAERYVDRPWYPAFLGFVAGVDLLILVVPVDPLFVSSVVIKPKRWISMAFAMTIGSTVGSFTLSLLIHRVGATFIEWLLPHAMQSRTWIEISGWMARYGHFALVLLAASPMALPVTVAVCAWSGMPTWLLTACVLPGRAVKFGFLGWAGSHAPRLLRKIGLSPVLPDSSAKN